MDEQYYILVDANNYVVSYSSEPREGFIPAEVPPINVGKGFYKYINNKYIVDNDKKEEVELASLPFADRFLKKNINNIKLSNNLALEAKSYYKNWSYYYDRAMSLNEGMFVNYNGKLWLVKQYIKVLIGSQYPGAQGLEALYEEVNKINAGTIDDPIPYNNNMKLENEKYYIQYEEIYLCNRDTGNPVYNDLKDLVGIYVVKV